MMPFLNGVASAYLSLPHQLLQHYCFLFPNKRSAAFFRKFLSEGLEDGETVLAPLIMTVDDFVEKFSGLIVDSHLDLLLSLYEAYIELLRKGDISDPDTSLVSSESSGDTAPHEEGLPDFDSFIRWGETVLNDFNDVDLFCVSREEVFRNVRDFKTITSDFLTDEQKEVMREYFNVEPSVSDVRHFWEHYPEKDDSGLGRFRRLWEILRPLYDAFSESLLDRGLATRGMATRRALENITQQGAALFPFNKIVAVGFNVLTMAEYKIFTELKRLKCDSRFIVQDDDSFADFFWDATGPVLSPPALPEDAAASESDNSASRFVHHNIRKFPAPSWALPYLRDTDKESFPEVLESIAAPSNAMQAKIAAEIVRREIIPELPVKSHSEIDPAAPISEQSGYSDADFSKANVAVVLPDEALLFPLMYSLPHKVDINLTMGYPLRQTASLSFVALLRRLLSRRRLRSDGALVFYKPFLISFLSHPFMQACGGGDAVRALNDYLYSLRLSEVCFADIEANIYTAEDTSTPSPLYRMLRLVMGFPKADADTSVGNVKRVIEFLHDVLGMMKRVLIGSATAVENSQKNGGNVEEASEDLKETATSIAGDVMRKARLDVAHIDVYLDALSRLSDSVEEHGVAMQEQTALFLADRLLGAEKVEFEGEPLTGLQVIGMLETRGLDFEYLVIPSMNERIFPRRSRSRSFIPDVLRVSYGMPPSNYQESLFSYYFYRMISRARKVWLIHDARMSTGVRNGEPSRYLSQLRYLYAPEKVVCRDSSFIIPERSTVTFDVEKVGNVVRELESYRRLNPDPFGKDNGDTRNLSASSLRHYMTCPVKFYYQDIAGLKEKDSFTEDLDPISMGNVFHGVMEILYPSASPENPKEVTAELIDSLLSHPEEIHEKVRLAIVNEHFKLSDPDAVANLLREGMPGGVEIVAKGITDNVIRTLRHDRTMTPFLILGSELKETFAYKVSPGDGLDSFFVNMKFAIDRLDLVRVKEYVVRQVEDKGKVKEKKEPVESLRLRIVDYKTGSAHLSAASFDDIFSSEYSASHIFQLMLYAHMLEFWKKYKKFDGHVLDRAESVRSTDGVGQELYVPDPAMEIYEVEDISESSSRRVPKIADEDGKLREVFSFVPWRDLFRSGLDNLLSEIFNLNVPFRQTDNLSDCRFCHLKELCRR